MGSAKYPGFDPQPLLPRGTRVLTKAHQHGFVTTVVHGPSLFDYLAYRISAAVYHLHKGFQHLALKDSNPLTCYLKLTSTPWKLSQEIGSGGTPLSLLLSCYMFLVLAFLAFLAIQCFSEFHPVLGLSVGGTPADLGQLRR